MGFLNRNWKKVAPVLFLVFLALVAVIWFQANQARAFNDFCEGNGFEVAGTMSNSLVCFRLHEGSVDYRFFECSNGCAFTAPERTYVFQDPNELQDLLEGVKDGG